VQDERLVALGLRQRLAEALLAQRGVAEVPQGAKVEGHGCGGCHEQQQWAEEVRAGWHAAILDSLFTHGHLHDVKTRLTEFEFTGGHEISTIPSFSLSRPLQELPSMFDDLISRDSLVTAGTGMAPLPLSGYLGGR
jgi:hypothetical protein